MSKRPYKPEVRQEYDLVHLIESFGSEDECHEYLEHLRWPNGVECPRCSSTKISRIAKRNQCELFRERRIYRSHLCSARRLHFRRWR